MAYMSYPMQCSALREDMPVAIQGRPCKIVGINTSKAGDETMVHIIAKDIFTGKEYEDTCPSTKMMEVPDIKTREYQLVDVKDNGFLGLMDDAGEVREDIKLPENDISKEIVDGFKGNVDIVVIVKAAMNVENAVGVKEMTK